jgi:predicted transcriptional regulator
MCGPVTIVPPKPVTGPKPNTSVRLDPALLAVIKEIAEATNRKRSEVIEFLLWAGIKQYRAEKKVHRKRT